ncbi:MAG TPA: DUF4394 domain-containing protein, partial [Pyrinomonadaceae bacterium]|nr:DUF4394 domain-containing protein [Pyrinomonadaceae bacterium]
MKRASRRTLFTTAAAAFFLLLAPTASAAPVVGLTDSNKLVLFDSTTPGVIAGTVNVTGLRPGESLLGIDTRPSTGRLYGVGSTSRLYVVNLATGEATQVGDGPFSPALNVSAAGGFEIGVSFDPLQDWLRVVSNGQSLRLDPDSGTVVAIDGPLFNSLGLPPESGRVPAVTGLAHGPGRPGSFTGVPTVFGIDWREARLVTVGSRGSQPVAATTGEVFRVGWLFVAFGMRDSRVFLTEKVGFDIPVNGPDSFANRLASYGFLSLTLLRETSSRLYLVNLADGLAHEVGRVGTPADSLVLRSLAALPDGTNLYALTATNKLLLFNANMPSAVLRSTQVAGLQPGESLLALEVRCRDGHLYAYGSTGRLYRINPSTGAAAQVGDPFTTPPAGSEFSLGRDTFRDRMRLVNDADQTWHLDFFPRPPVITAAGALRYAADDPNAGQNPRVVGLAGTPGREQLFYYMRYYGIDADKDALVYEEEPDFGTLHTVGPLGADAGDFTGLEIGFATYASFTNSCPGPCAAPSSLHTVNLQTGQATLVGAIGGGEAVRDITTAPTQTVHFSKAVYRVEEACTAVDLVVVRTGFLGSEPVFYTTSDGGAEPFPPASGRSDYTAASGVIRFADGESMKTLRILVSDDSYDERAGGLDAEGFTVTLSTAPDAANGFAVAPPFSAVVLIAEPEEGADDGQFNPIDFSDTFVCQQYHDFLGREPDDAGRNFWTGNIESCRFDDAACREVKRIETAAAFFLSIEFQETGFFVYRVYQAAYGRTPAPLTFAEFTRDASRVAEGVVVGQPDALARLEANKRAFIEEFTRRPEFVARYPFIRPNEAENYVDSLNANAGFVVTPAERDAMVAEYRTSGAARQSIL